MISTKPAAIGLLNRHEKGAVMAQGTPDEVMTEELL